LGLRVRRRYREFLDREGIAVCGGTVDASRS
jgi:hypothetical protein